MVERVDTKIHITNAVFIIEFEAVCNFSEYIGSSSSTLIYCSSFVCNVKVDNKSRDRYNPLRKVVSVDT